MKLRPHHILCIQKFTGHGYDAEFTRHMAAVVSALKNRPETDITITQGCDELCGRCPNNAGSACTSLEKVDKMDSLVLDICGLTCGNSVRWSELAVAAREKIFKTEEFNSICARCQWFGLCKNTEVNYGQNYF